MTDSVPARVTPCARVLPASNPGPMTLDGTNSYLLAAPGAAGCVVVDPGPSDAEHLGALAREPVELILITHRHHDHTDGAAELAARTGARVRALDPDFCWGGPPLIDGETIDVAGLRISVVSTPGHTNDSVCFLLPEDGQIGSVLAGDTILGRGTTVLSPPDGSLGAYLGSLEVLAGLGSRYVLPAHGPQLPDLAGVAAQYLAHRQQRLGQIRSALDVLGPDAGVGAVTDLVYGDVDASVRFAAEHSVAAQLDYLGGPGPRRR